MKILYIKASPIHDVRLAKFIKYFIERRDNVVFWGWDRMRTAPQMDHVETVYILKGGGYGKRKLGILYVWWMVKLFVKALFTNFSRYDTVTAINFEAAFPIYLASKIRKINYIYELYDDFVLSHNFPRMINRFLTFWDHKVMHSSEVMIHVDRNRVFYKDCNWIVIENTPADYFNGAPRDYAQLTSTFAIVGYLPEHRGLDSMYLFAKENPRLSFLVVGVFLDKDLECKFRQLANVKYHDFMPQNQLFELLSTCCAVFSLYDPKLEINKLAASNKLYDAMMMGIPVITNPEVINSDYISDNKIGLIVDYAYNGTWDVLKRDDFMTIAAEIGANGRQLYLSQYKFEKIVEDRLLPYLGKK